MTQQQGGTPVEIATTSVDAANRFAFEHVATGDDYLVRLLGIDDGPLGPCSSPDLFAVYPGETSRVLISCWR